MDAPPNRPPTKKATVSLEPDVDTALGRLAAQRGITKAELVRRILRETVEAELRPPITAIGVGEGSGDVSTDIDRHLAETDFGERDRYDRSYTRPHEDCDLAAR